MNKKLIRGIRKLFVPFFRPSTPGGSQEIPGWVKNNADWRSQGLVSDGDFIKGITFMVENGIITV